jgi:hypothetical protein
MPSAKERTMTAPTAFVALLRAVGPKAAAAVARYGPAVIEVARKNPQVKSAVENLRTNVRRPGTKLQKRVRIGKDLAQEVLEMQTIAERQERCGRWLSRWNLLESKMHVANTKTREARSRDLEGIAEDADTLLSEMFETIGKWSEEAL